MNAFSRTRTWEGSIWVRPVTVIATLACIVLAGVFAGYAPVRLASGVTAGLAVVAIGLAGSSSSALRRIGVLLIGATFVTRFRLDVAGFGLRPEHLVLAVAAVAVLTGGLAGRALRIARQPTFLLLGAYVLWAGIAAAAAAPDPPRSLAIVGWLGMDWLIAILVVTIYWDRGAALEIDGLRIASVMFALALLIWVWAQVGGGAYGLQAEYVTGSRALYGLSFEANLLGSTAAAWVYIALTSGGRVSRALVAFVVVVGAVVLLLTFTRAAALGLGIGLLLTPIFRSSIPRAVLVRRLAAGMVLLAVVAAAVPQISGPIFSKLGQVTAVNDTTGSVRLDSIETALADLRAQPSGFITGLGPNSFGQRHFEPTLPTERVPAYLGVFPLEILYGTGLIGLLLLVGALASMAVVRGPSSGRAVGLSVVFLVSSLATSPFWLGSTWILIAIAVLSSNGRTRMAAPTRG